MSVEILNWQAGSLSTVSITDSPSVTKLKLADLDGLPDFDIDGIPSLEIDNVRVDWRVDTVPDVKELKVSNVPADNDVITLQNRDALETVSITNSPSVTALELLGVPNLTNLEIDDMSSTLTSLKIGAVLYYSGRPLDLCDFGALEDLNVSGVNNVTSVINFKVDDDEPSALKRLYIYNSNFALGTDCSFDLSEFNALENLNLSNLAGLHDWDTGDIPSSLKSLTIQNLVSFEGSLNFSDFNNLDSVSVINLPGLHYLDLSAFIGGQDSADPIFGLYTLPNLETLDIRSMQPCNYFILHNLLYFNHLLCQLPF